MPTISTVYAHHNYRLVSHRVRTRNKAIRQACILLAAAIRANKRRKAMVHTPVSASHLESIWRGQDGKCALSGIPLGFPGCGLMAASVDRKDNAQGYNKHNIQLVCKWINLGRGQHSTDEMLAALMAHRDPAAYIEVIRQAGNPPPPKALMRSPVLNAEMQQLLDELSQ